jgi:transposase
MCQHNVLSVFWPGFLLADLQVHPQRVCARLQPDPQAGLVCSHCQGQCVAVHDSRWRSIRELPMLGRKVELEVLIQRVACPVCGPRVQHIDWLGRHQRVTQRLAQAVALGCAKLPVAHVAEWFDLHWSTVREIDRRHLRQRLSELPAAQPQRLIMDEFALHRGHRYASVVLDADTRRVLWVGLGRSRAAVREFFAQLGPDGCARIQAVAMDMNTAYDLEVRQHCPRARIVYDLFHVVAKYGREVISRVRVDAANQLRDDKPARRVVKQAYWLLLRNPARLEPRQQVRLHEVLQANQSLMTVYIMKDALKSLWTAPNAWEWRRRWKQWLEHARQSEIPALIRFADLLKPYWRGILSRVRWPMHTGTLEGINNKIKLIKRMAFGYRDTDYFFLKIKAAFPGNP